MNSNSYALRSPDELLRLFTLMYGKGTKGAQYTCEYIKGILKNKGYNILIEGNIYSLTLTMPNKETMYEMPISELMNLYHKLVHKKDIPYIPDKLRKTLMRRVNSILNNRGCTVHKDDFKPVIFEGLKDAMVYAQATGNNDWVVMSAMSAMDIGRRMHELVFGEDKENVKLNKENKMKNILIKFENELLVKYVATKLRDALNLSQVAPKINIEGGKYSGLIIRKNTIAEFRYNIVNIEHAKVFTITNATNADIIIEATIEEYNKIECDTFNIGGGFGSRTIKVQVYRTHIVFDNHNITFADFHQLHSAMNLNVGRYQIGGVESVLITRTDTDEKIYMYRHELNDILQSVLKAQINA